LTANSHENADLFWALRGGGGNFGVVTSLLFKLNPAGLVYGGPMFYPIEKAARIMKYWQDYILNAPENINGWFGFHTVPPVPMFPKEHHLKKVCNIVWCYTGEMDKAEQVFKPIREFEKPLMDFAGPIPYPALQSLFDALYPPGLQWYWRSEYIKELSDNAIDIHVRYGNQMPTPGSLIHMYPINGAAHKVDAQASAWSYRDANFIHIIAAVDPDPANNDRMTQWAKSYYDASHPYSAGGGYLNVSMTEGEERVKEAFRDNYPRLARIKQKYDPTNFFRANQNILPAA
jgi:FAD/FMN-containing dehydrogenase